MALKGLTPHPNKAVSKERVKKFVLLHCDMDIQQVFEPHGFMVEPLLLQLIRDIKHLKGNDYYADYLRSLASAISALEPTTGRNPQLEYQDPPDECREDKLGKDQSGEAEE